MCWPEKLITHKYKLLNVLGMILFVLSSAIITLATFPYLLYVIFVELFKSDENVK